MYEAILKPRRVAVVGASTEEGKVGRVVFDNLRRSPSIDEVIPVNPKAAEIAGVPAVASVDQLDGAVDLAIICVPAKLVPSVVDVCGRKGIRGVIVISAGFKEVGGEGKVLEAELRRVCHTHRIDMIGPNCLGVLNVTDGINASFATRLPPVGHIGLMSQSGALATALLDIAEDQNIGFSVVVSVGNKAVVDETDLLRAFTEDDDTRVIAAYLEDITRGEDFVLLAEKAARSKPIIVIKSGTSQAGAVAASSHTGSIAGAEVAYECAFARSGIIRAESVEQMFDYALAFGNQPLPSGRRVAVITNAGGPGIMAVDACERESLGLAEFADGTRGYLTENLPAAANTANPVDVLGDAPAARYELALRAVLGEPGVDAVVVVLTPQAMTDADATARAIIETAAGSTKPVLCSFVGGQKVAGGIATLREHDIPTYPTPERAVHCVRAMSEYHEWLNRPPRVVKRFPVNRYKVERVIKVALRKGTAEIGEEDAKKILRAYGFDTPQGALCRTPDEAVEFARTIGYPVVLKIASPDILHKSDVGGVKLSLPDDEALRDAFELMMLRVGKRQPKAHILGAFVQEMIAGGKEVILGVNRDPQFGHMVMFGMGGVYVEVLKDVAFHLAPITKDEALEMLVGTKTYALLAGVRGERPVDIDAIAESIQRLSQLVVDFPNIEEMDINPLKVGAAGGGAWAVDARFRISEEQL